MLPAVVNSSIEQIATPKAPSGRIPNSIRPPDQMPASTLPKPTPSTRANNSGTLSVSYRAPALESELIDVQLGQRAHGPEEDNAQRHSEQRLGSTPACAESRHV